MDKKDLIFLISALATSNKFSGRADPDGVKEYFMHWHTIYSDIYDELSKPDYKKKPTDFCHVDLEKYK